MLSLLPPYLQQFSEMEGIMNTETVEIEKIRETHSQIVDNRYIEYCNEDGISRYEKIMNIEPFSDDTLEDRKLRCLTKWNQKLPYNYVRLQGMLSDICGEGGFTLELDLSVPKLVVRLALGVKNQFAIVKNMVEAMVPAHVVTSVVLQYNTNDMVGAYTHSQLSKYTHDSLRNDVF